MNRFLCLVLALAWMVTSASGQLWNPGTSAGEDSTGLTARVEALEETAITTELDPDLAAQNAAALDPTGFDSPSDVAITYDATNRTVTLTQAGGVDLWWRGEPVTLTSPWTSSAHTNAAGTYYLAMRTTTNFVWSSDPWTFDMLQAAIIKKTATDVFATRELHSAWMPASVHEECHRAIGAFRESGGEPVVGTYQLANADAASNQTPSFAAMTLHDEDNETTLDLWPQDFYRKLYFTGSGTLNFSTNSSMIRVGTIYPKVNTWSGSSWSEVETVGGRFLNYWQICVPTASDTTSKGYRMLILQPQVAHSTLAAARTEYPSSLQLGGLSALGPEVVAYTRLTFGTSASYSAIPGRARLEEFAFMTGAQGSVAVVGNLIAPSAANQISFSPAGSLEALNVQAALQELDADHTNHVAALDAHLLTNNLTVTVGPTGDFGTISNAVAFMSQYRPANGVTGTIELQAAYTNDGDLVLVEGLDIGWVTIAHVDGPTGVVTVVMDSLLATSDQRLISVGNGVAPRISARFVCDETPDPSSLDAPIGMYISQSRAWVDEGSGFCNFNIGIAAYDCSDLYAYGAVCTNNSSTMSQNGFGLYVASASRAYAGGANCDSGEYAIRVELGSQVYYDGAGSLSQLPNTLFYNGVIYQP